MKIMAHTDYGYLVEMTRAEIEHLCGKCAEHKGGFYNQTPHGIGTTFKIAPVISQVHALNRSASEAKLGAGYLRALADQLDREIPQWIQQPDTEQKP